MRSVFGKDPAIYDAMMAEYRRQQDELELIVRELCVSRGHRGDG